MGKRLSLTLLRRAGLNITGASRKKTETQKQIDREKVERARKTFFEKLTAHGIPIPEHEFRFNKTAVSRKGKLRIWRFDYAWQDLKIALEVDGGIYSGGRHVRGKGFREDMEKMNEAVAQGWVVIRTTPRELPTLYTIDMIRRVREVRT